MRLIHKVLALGIAFNWLTCVSAQTDLAPQTRPNIIYVMVDDMGYAELGVLGQTRYRTPRLDQMAREGILFTQSYCGSTVCAPSRAALLAGQHTGHLWQRANLGPLHFREDPYDLTIASLLQDAGYATALIGKSGLSCNSTDGALPNRKGFDYFFGMVSHRRAHRHYPEYVFRNGERVDLPGNHGYTGEQYVSEVFVDDALVWLEQAASGDEPFFLHLALTPPHADTVVPERYRAPYMGQFNEQPYRGGGYAAQSHPQATQAGMIAFLDDQMGRLLDHLATLGLADNTVVFFSSDNGPHMEGGIHRAMDRNGPLRGYKRDLYEGGIRTPLIVWWPGTIEPNQTSDLPNAFWDFMPTACDLAGIDTPEWTDGLSIVPTLLGNLDAQQVHEYLYWEFYEGGGKQAVRMGDWKGVRLNVHRNPNGPIELYHLPTDIGEERNVASEHPEIVARIVEIMAEAHVPTDVFAFGRQPNVEALPLPADRFLPEAALLDQANWRIVEVSSESRHNGKLAGNAIDDNPRTNWHTQWRNAQPSHPHYLTIDLGASQSIAGIRVMPRQDGEQNGRLNRIEVYVSDDAAGLADQLVYAGRFEDHARQQEARFDSPVTGRYLKLVALDSHNDRPFTSIGELDVLAGE